ncbi:MAG: Glu/Leu/Phe/Val dehydrogenase dimerization domain-containing protein [Actinomycetota bacterium]
MGVFDRLGSEYEQIVFAHEPTAGLRAIFAIHSTRLGPALGGTRIWPYTSEDAALTDVLRLSKAMAYKAAAAGLALGGGKAVIIGDPARDKTPDLLQAYGRHVERLGGKYLTTADAGTTVADLDLIATTTRYVTGTSHGSGDPSPMTAHGVLHGLAAVAQELWGDPSLEKRHVLIQGVGKVGGALARALAGTGARLSICDINREHAKALAEEIGARAVEADSAIAAECDILAPCALGPVVTDNTLGTLRCRAVAGAANNQLATPEHGRALAAAGILYAPDYVINAGGLINVEDELHGYDEARARAKTEAIAITLRDVFERARAAGITPGEAADRLAEARIRHGARALEDGTAPG